MWSQGLAVASQREVGDVVIAQSLESHDTWGFELGMGALLHPEEAFE